MPKSLSIKVLHEKKYPCCSLELKGDNLFKLTCTMAKPTLALQALPSVEHVREESGYEEACCCCVSAQKTALLANLLRIIFNMDYFRSVNINNMADSMKKFGAQTATFFSRAKQVCYLIRQGLLS